MDYTKKKLSKKVDIFINEDELSLSDLLEIIATNKNYINYPDNIMFNYNNKCSIFLQSSLYFNRKIYVLKRDNKNVSSHWFSSSIWN